MRTDRQMIQYRHTDEDMLITILCTPSQGEEITFHPRHSTRWFTLTILDEVRTSKFVARTRVRTHRLLSGEWHLTNWSSKGFFTRATLWTCDCQSVISRYCIETAEEIKIVFGRLHLTAYTAF